MGMFGFDDALRIVGSPLLGSSGYEIGSIAEIYLDPETEELAWARVRLGEAAAAYTFVPLPGARRTDRGLLVQAQDEVVLQSPRNRISTRLSAELMTELTAYYDEAGVPLPETENAIEVKRLAFADAEAAPRLEGGSAAGIDAELPESGSTRAAAGTASRYLQARCPQETGLGAVVPLQVRVDLRAGDDATASAELRPFDVPEEGAELTIVLHSPGFTVRGQQLVTLHVPAVGPSEWRLFELVADREGVCDITITAFRDGSHVGELALQVTVQLGAAEGDSVDHAQNVGSVDSVPGETTLYISYDRERKVYEYRFIGDNAQGEEVSRPLLRAPREVVEELVEELNTVAKGESAFGAKETRKWLENKGVELWNELMPDALKVQFWQRRDQITSLTICADSEPVPWELLYPLAKGRDEGFLAEQFPIMRWVSGSGCRVDRMTLADPLFVLPDDSPERARDEVKRVRAMLGGGRGRSIRDLSRLLDKLEAGEFGAMHFACHNNFDAERPTSSSVQMAGGGFMPTFLSRAAVTRPLESRAPLVFMNACRSAGEAAHYTQLSGWGRAFAAAGAGAFIGSQWEVRDHSAPIFAEAFYDAFKRRGRTLGDALQDGRAAVKELPGDPTWLAYTAFGSPSAKAV